MGAQKTASAGLILNPHLYASCSKFTTEAPADAMHTPGQYLWIAKWPATEIKRHTRRNANTRLWYQANNLFQAPNPSSLRLLAVNINPANESARFAVERNFEKVLPTVSLEPENQRFRSLSLFISSTLPGGTYITRLTMNKAMPARSIRTPPNFSMRARFRSSSEAPPFLEDWRE
jgi:hypothetical protein